MNKYAFVFAKPGNGLKPFPGGVNCVSRHKDSSLRDFHRGDKLCSKETATSALATVFYFPANL